MIYPIVKYGQNILRTEAKAIDKNYPQLQTIIDNMWETLYHTNGVGLAAPQINLSIQLFLIDTIQVFKDDKKLEYPDKPGVKEVIINPKIIESTGEMWSYEEGCLSIPKIRSNISRLQYLTMEYYDINFEKKILPFTGLTARVIFHEYDHLKGKLFIDLMSPVKKKIINSKLKNITQGKVNTFYRMI